MVGHAEELKRSMAAHLRAAGWLAFTELPLGSVLHSGGHVQRADVFALAKSYRVHAVIYEVKISRNDFLADVTAGKYEGYFQYARRVLFAVPRGLVKPEEVPERCGLITFNPDKGWHTQRSGRPGEAGPSPDVLLAALFRGVEEATEVRALRERINLSDNMDLADRAKNLGWRIAQRLRTGNPQLAQVEEARQALEEFLAVRVASVGDGLWMLQTRLHHMKGAEYLDTASQLVTIARDLVNEGPKTLWGQHALKRLSEVMSELQGEAEA